ncbi:hypothetical protein MAPG_00380 [Magnaporthiopsis poae ATCC 64411]|uniref:Uncharacterized protein n=1 Tax=Magnaporthiopsis poae (strain ATCC 64411 / 73-15) TaxID=644358 RepID=A0A0C4DKV0_MAGP6|nr:hypothetical protein MAPG_00380 [Magnaporthiopsis poae ATCC 64411]
MARKEKKGEGLSKPQCRMMLPRFGPGAAQSKGLAMGSRTDGLRAKEGGKERRRPVGSGLVDGVQMWRKAGRLGWAGGLLGLKKGASDASVLCCGRRGLAEVEVRVDVAKGLIATVCQPDVRDREAEHVTSFGFLESDQAWVAALPAAAHEKGTHSTAGRFSPADCENLTDRVLVE